MSVLLLGLLLAAAAPAAEKKAECTCTCVVKEGESYSTKTASGPDREAAGEALKKKLGAKLKCELSPDCKGGC